MENSKTFRMMPEGLGRMAERLGQFNLPLFCFIVLFVVGLAHLSSDPNSSTLAFGFVAGVVAGVLLAYLFPQGYAAKMRDDYESFEIHLGPDWLLRKQEEFSDWTIRREDVHGITENYQGGLLVRTSDVHASLYIPGEIEGFDELRTVLAQWAGPVSATAERLNQVVLSAGALVGAFAHFGRELTANPWVRFFAHLASALLLLWSFPRRLRSPVVDERSRKWAWFILVVALAELYFAIRLLPELLGR